METLSNLAESLVQWLARTSAQVAVVIAAVALLTWIFRRWLSPGARCGLWGLVAVRLVMPVTPPSDWSIFNWTPAGGVTERKVIGPGPGQDGLGSGWVIQAEVEAIDDVVAAGGVVQLEAARPAPPRWPVWLCGVWVAGVVAVLARVAWVNVRLARRVGGGRRVKEAWVLEELRRAAGAMGVRRLPEVVETDAVGGPALAGLWRAKLLLPPGLLMRLGAEELRFVMLHELAHLKRRDLWVDWGLALVQAVHWFNPLVWWSFARLREERELARDEMVTGSAGEGAERLGYGGTIVKVVEQLARGWAAPRPGAVGMGRCSRTLRRRIQMIIEGRRVGFGGTVVALLVAAAVVFGTMTDRSRAQEGAAAPAPAARPKAEGLKFPADWPEVDDREGRAAAEAVEKTRHKLERKVDLTLEGVGLSDALERWREPAGVDLVISWKALAGAGVDEDTKVNVRARGVTLAKVLTLILDSASGEKKAKLAYVVDADRGKKDAYVWVSTREEAGRASSQIVVYDIRDLLEPAADLEAEGEKVKAVPDEARREQLVKEVIELIQETVDRESWREHGGQLGSIKHLKGQLIVSQSGENQGQIKRLIDQLREGRAVQIMMEAKFLHVAEDFFKELKDEQGEPLERRLVPAEPNRPKKWGLSMWVLDEANVNRIMAAAAKQEKATILSAPRLITFNGQKANVTIGNQQPYVKDLKVVEKGGGKEFEPVLGTAESGLKLNLQGTVSADRKYVTLGVNTAVTDFVGLKSVEFRPKAEDTEAAQGKKLEVQTPEMDVRQADTVVSLPDRSWLLLTGLKLTTRDGQERIARDTVVLVKPTIIIQREVEGPQFPLEPKRK